MKGYWNNLRPLEKRMVVGVAVMFFVILNAWFVFPHFSDWGLVQQRMIKARKTLNVFETEIRQKPFYDAQIKILQGEESQPIPLEDQAGAFADTIRTEAERSHVQIQQFGRIVPRTNDQFFWEQTATINVISKEQQLVDFLYNLGSGGSLVRVRDLTLRPDQPHQQLTAGIKLVANYQKKAPSKSAAAPTSAKSAVPSPQPATPTSKAPPPATKQPAPTKKAPVPATKGASPTNKPPVSTTKK